MGQQQQRTLPISLGIREAGRRAGNRLMEVIREVVREEGKQEAVARILGISPELLSQALRSQRTFHADWLPALFAVDHEFKILKHLAWQAHCRVIPVDPFTDADRVKATEEVLREDGRYGESVRQRILERAQQIAEERSGDDP